MIRSATLILPTSRLQFYFNFASYNEMCSFNSVIFMKDNWTYCYIVFCIFKPLPFFKVNKK